MSDFLVIQVQLCMTRHAGLGSFYLRPPKVVCDDMQEFLKRRET